MGFITANWVYLVALVATLAILGLFRLLLEWLTWGRPQLHKSRVVYAIYEITDDTFGAVGYLLARLLKSLNWRLVRAVGELQILTRVSYTALIVVPLIAAFWPGISATMSVYNRMRHRSVERTYESLEHIRAAVDQASDQITQHVGSTDLDRSGLTEALGRTLSAVEKAQSSIERLSDLERDTKGPALPRSFVLAFFGALSAVGGHLLYQMFADEILRKETLSGFTKTREEEYGRHHNPELLETSITRLGEDWVERQRTQDRLWSSLPQDKLAILLSGPSPNQVRSPIAVDQILRLYYRLRILFAGPEPVTIPRSVLSALHLGESPSPETVDETVHRIFNNVEQFVSNESEVNEAFVRKLRDENELSVVGRAASLEYVEIASRRRAAAILSFGLFAVTMYFLALVIYDQARSVMQTSGLSISDVFSWR